MRDVEIIDLTDRLAPYNVHPAIVNAMAIIRDEYTRPVWAEFKFNTVTVTVARDSDPKLLAHTVMVQQFNPDKSAARACGPYPAQLTFDDAQASSHQLIYRMECVSVQAYRLDKPGWVERINRGGEIFTNWYGFVGDWYVKIPDAPEIRIIPDAEFTPCPCPTHHL